MPRGGFSLIELVIVIVILSIIAAIAIPRIGRAAAAANESSLVTNLATMRKAIDCYAAEHHGVYPGAQKAGTYGAAGTDAAFTSQLLMYTDAAGDCSKKRDQTHLYGPYLGRIPPLSVGPNSGSAKVSVANNGPMSAIEDGSGWVYNCLTGQIIANADSLEEGQKSPYDAY